jgi:hypothetical protein
VFFLAGAESENFEDFISILNSGIITGPLFWFFGSYLTDMIFKHSWLSNEDRLKLDSLWKKLKSKWAKHKEYLNKLTKSPPLLLLPSTIYVKSSQ